MKKAKTLESSLRDLLEKMDHRPMSIKRILEILSGNGKPLVLIFLCLPFCQPIQIPGTSIPFGLAIAFIGIRLAFGKHILLPKKISAKKISSHTLRKITDKVLPVVRKLKKWVHPRLQVLIVHPAMHILNGLVISAMGLFLALPLPIPLSNLIAAWGILLICLGMLEDDGAFVIAGYVFALVTIAFLVTIAVSADKFIKHEEKMHRTGLEPVTTRFEAGYSIH
jgi:hypothetical protein